VTIDATTPESPGWWMARLSKRLRDKQKRLAELNDRFEGNPPLPRAVDPWRPHVADFQKKSRTNFAELIVTSARRRMQIVGIGTSAVADDRGDEEAWRIHSLNNMAVVTAEVHESMGTFGEAYVMVFPSPRDGSPRITAEDPRSIIVETEYDGSSEVVAAFKTFHDDIGERDLAYLYLPAETRGRRAEMYIAQRRGRRASGTVSQFNSSWEWVSDDEGYITNYLYTDDVPVVRFLNNQRATGDFEGHVDLLDRINHQILQRLVIATFQAFRQRAVKGDLPSKDDNGREIYYDDVFTADPGALWQLPEGVELWESGQVDLTPILKAVKDDLQELSAVTSVPLHVFSPDAATQSAEGASLLKEQETFKVEDKIARATGGWRDVYGLAFECLGDATRADRSQIRIQWARPDRPSMQERAQAASQVATLLPARHVLTDFLGYPLDVVEEILAERAVEGLVAPAAPTLAPAPVVDDAA
jgi:hypothetical protein